MIQDRYGYLSARHLAALAAEMKLAMAEVYETATFYAHFENKDDLFTYLAKTGRTIKISGAMMGSSWMGSHFTNDDLVAETRLSLRPNHRW